MESEKHGRTVQQRVNQCGKINVLGFCVNETVKPSGKTGERHEHHAKTEMNYPENAADYGKDNIFAFPHLEIFFDKTGAGENQDYN